MRASTALWCLVLSGCLGREPNTSPETASWSAPFVMESDLELGPVGAPMTLHLTGKVVVTERRVGDEVDVSLRAEEVNASARGAAPEAWAPIAAALGQEVHATYTSGTLTRVPVATDSPALATGIVRALLAALQRPPDRAESSFFRLEHDGTGAYLARWTPDDSPGAWRREKLAYTTLLAPPGAFAKARPDALPVIERSLMQVELAKGGTPTRLAWPTRVTRVSLEERLRVMAKAGLPLTVTTRLTLGPASMVASSSTDLDTPDRAASIPVNEAWAHHTLDDALATARREAMSFDEALATLSTSTAKEVSRPGFDRDARAFAALSAHLGQDPALVGRVVAALEDAPARTALLDVLSAAGVAQAQDALAARALDSQRPVVQRAEAAFALGRIALPSPTTVAALTRLADEPDLIAHGLYGLGTAARRLRLAADPQAEVIATDLAQRLARAVDLMTRVHVLRACANAADPALIPAIEPYLAAPEDPVRVAAAEALRWVADPKVDALLIERLAIEAAPRVRDALVGAIGVRPPNSALVSSLARVGQADPDSNVRFEVGKALAAALSSQPEAAVTLAWMAKHDAEPKVRELVAKALEGHAREVGTQSVAPE